MINVKLKLFSQPHDDAMNVTIREVNSRPRALIFNNIEPKINRFLLSARVHVFGQLIGNV